jgi:hypothetical protein
MQCYSIFKSENFLIEKIWKHNGKSKRKLCTTKIIKYFPGTWLMFIIQILIGLAKDIKSNGYGN